MKRRVRILLLNYNGRELLERYLPSFLEAARASSHDCRVGVVDNCSSDGSAEYLRRHFLDVTVYTAASNRVLCSYNEAAAALEDDILILMNNDMRVEKDFVDPLVAPFLEGPDVFFVTPRCLSMADGSYEGSRTRARMHFGVFWSSSRYPGHERDIDKPGLTFHAGFGAFDRRKFLELGGYDDLYLPGRLEDADLCFRAQKRGWKCLYRPDSVVRHEGGTSFHRRFGAYGTLVINWRNTFLFMWKNLEAGLIARSCVWLPARLAYSLVTFRTELFAGFCRALPLLPQALSRRRALRLSAPAGAPAVPDLEIFGRT